MDLMPSIVWKGHRMRTLWATMHARPKKETFHEFLISVVQWTLGEEWWKHQIRMDEESQHVVVQWRRHYADLVKQAFAGGGATDAKGRRWFRPTGPAWALVSLGYDLYCLQAKDRLPGFLATKLRKNQSFQSARYEVAVAAIMARSGYNIEFLDEVGIKEKHCEFLATHPSSEVQIGVEAKSRVRAGVLHEPGKFQYSKDARGLEKLIRKAVKQKPKDLPFMIFLDLNLPASPGVPLVERGWFKDVNVVLDRLSEGTLSGRDPYNVVVCTNFAPHLGPVDGAVPPAEWGMVVSERPGTPLEHVLLEPITVTLGRYWQVPDEV